MRTCRRLVSNRRGSPSLGSAAIVVTHFRKRATVSSVSDLATGSGA